MHIGCHLGRPCLARLGILLLVVTAAGFAVSVAAGGVVNSSFLGGVAIEGTDPVAYFSDRRPVQGSSAFEHAWTGAVWRFASAENRDAFAADPEKYAPQYGGKCDFGGFLRVLWPSSTPICSTFPVPLCGAAAPTPR